MSPGCWPARKQFWLGTLPGWRLSSLMANSRLCLLFLPLIAPLCLAATLTEVKPSGIGGMSGSTYGNDVAISASTMAVAAPTYSGSITDTGAVFIFSRKAGAWSLNDTLYISTTSSNFGAVVAIDGSGTRIVVGSPSLAPGGNVRIYHYQGGKKSWQVAMNTNGTAVMGSSGSLFGSSVAISDDGLIAIIGAPPDSGCGIYIYQRSGDTWTLKATAAGSYQEKMGASVALADDYSLAVGVPGYSTSAGAVFMYGSKVNGWSRGQTLQQSTPTSYQRLGYSVAVSPDGMLVVAGGYGSITYSVLGKASVFYKSGTTWSEVQTLADAEATSDYYGWAVALGNAGYVLAVAGYIADNNNANNYDGKVWLYRRSDGTNTFQLQQTIVAPTTAATSQFGYSVSFNRNGTYLAVGRPQAGSGGTSYVYEQGSAWRTMVPTSRPTTRPTSSPTNKPTAAPTMTPTTPPTTSPTRQPTAPTTMPTTVPSVNPSTAPSTVPSLQPSTRPSTSPSNVPSKAPSMSPSTTPTTVPTRPTTAPSLVPSTSPTLSPTLPPTTLPTLSPSTVPTRTPSTSPSKVPTLVPTRPTTAPSTAPSTRPTVTPSKAPSLSPTQAPTQVPSLKPTLSPTTTPSTAPSKTPTTTPSAAPTKAPTLGPTAPTVAPTRYPTGISPTPSPTPSPTRTPSKAPSAPPSTLPTLDPTTRPTKVPSEAPTSLPTTPPTTAPSKTPTAAPTETPSKTPTAAPTPSPPTALPTTTPTAAPTAAKTRAPTPNVVTMALQSTTITRDSDPTSSVVNPSSYITIQATGLTPVSGKRIWYCANSSLVDLTDSSIRNSGLDDFYLVLNPHALSGGLYTFYISTAGATWPSANGQITISVNKAPTGGNITASPLKGVAFTTLFHLQASGWHDPESDLPLEYRFYSSSLGSDLAPSSFESYLETVLAPSRNVTTAVSVSDSLGATSAGMQGPTLNVSFVWTPPKVTTLMTDLGTGALTTGQAQNSTASLGPDMTLAALKTVSLKVGSMLSMLPNLPNSIINMTQLIVTKTNVTAARLATASSVLLNTVSGTNSSNALSPAIQEAAMTAWAALVTVMDEHDSSTSTEGACKQVLPSVTKGFSLLVQQGLVTRNCSATNGEVVADSLSTLLKSCTTRMAPGETPISHSAGALGASAAKASMPGTGSSKRITGAGDTTAMTLPRDLFDKYGLSSIETRAVNWVSDRYTCTGSSGASKSQSSYNETRLWKGMTTFQVASGGSLMKVSGLSTPIGLELPGVGVSIKRVKGRVKGAQVVECRLGVRLKYTVACATTDANATTTVLCDGKSSYNLSVICPPMPLCAYWDGSGWSTSGCTTVGWSKNSTMCKCTHLTDFTLIEGAATRFIMVASVAEDLNVAYLKKNWGIFLLMCVLYALFLILLLEARASEAKKQDVFFDIVRHAPFYKHAMDHARILMSAGLSEKKRLGCQTYLPPDLGTDARRDLSDTVRVVYMKKRIRIALIASTEREASWFNGFLKFFRVQPKVYDESALTALGPSSSLNRTTRLLVEHSKEQRTLQIFLHTLTVLFMSALMYDPGSTVITEKADGSGYLVMPNFADLSMIASRVIQRLLVKTPIVTGMAMLLYEINRESRRNLAANEEFLLREYGFVNPRRIRSTDVRYVASLRIAISQLQLVLKAMKRDPTRRNESGGFVEPAEADILRTEIKVFKNMLQTTLEERMSNVGSALAMHGFTGAMRHISLFSMWRTKNILPDFSQNPLERFDGEFKVSRAFDRWMMARLRYGPIDRIARGYFRLFVADPSKSLVVGEKVSSRLVWYDLIMALYVGAISLFLFILGSTSLEDTVVAVLYGFFMTIVADAVLYNPLYGSLRLRLNQMMSRRLSQRMDLERAEFTAQLEEGTVFAQARWNTAAGNASFKHHIAPIIGGSSDDEEEDEREHSDARARRKGQPGKQGKYQEEQEGHDEAYEDDRDTHRSQHHSPKARSKHHTDRHQEAEHEPPRVTQAGWGMGADGLLVKYEGSARAPDLSATAEVIEKEVAMHVETKGNRRSSASSPSPARRKTSVVMAAKDEDEPHGSSPRASGSPKRRRKSTLMTETAPDQDLGSHASPRSPTGRRSSAMLRDEADDSHHNQRRRGVEEDEGEEREREPRATASPPRRKKSSVMAADEHEEGVSHSRADHTPTRRRSNFGSPKEDRDERAYETRTSATSPMHGHEGDYEEQHTEKVLQAASPRQPRAGGTDVRRRRKSSDFDG